MDNGVSVGGVLKWTAATIVIIVIVIGALFGIFAGMNAFGRYQAIANAQNQVQVNEIVIAQTNQLVQVENQKAQIRIADAKGIATAQTIIASSLTQAYLEYLAIQAQQTAAASGDHTSTIYIPAGVNGIPIIATQPAIGK